MNQTFADTAFAGKTVFITGASQGIGYAIAEAFLQTGAFVIGTAMNEEGKAAFEALAAGRGAGIVLNVTDPELDAKLPSLLEGLPEVDIVVNNAGITRDKLALRMTDDDFEVVLAVNLTGAFRVSRYFLRGLMKKRAGRIINIASVVGLTGNPGQANYVASKAGLIGLTKTLAREIGSRGVTVNAVAPGFIETRMTEALSEEVRQQILSTVPLNRFGTARDVAGAVLYLASDAAGYVSGVTLSVNGALACH